jgi:hypothetical protein
MRNTIAFLLLMLAASTAHAQNQPAPTNGPLVLERIHDGWVLAPDFKVTDFDNRAGELAGAYGGRLIDRTILIGGAGYWLANDDRDFKLAYGGFLVGWQSAEHRRIRFGGRGLVGAGQATLGFDVTPALTQATRAGEAAIGVPSRGDIRFGATPQNPRGGIPPSNFTVDPRRPLRIAARDEFFVVEPQAIVTARIVGDVGISCGVSYRATALADALRDRLNGPTASLAIQFGW